MIIAGASIPIRRETTFRKCQYDTYIVYCPFVAERQNITIIFERLVKSADTDPLLKVHIGPKTLMPSENTALTGSKGEASNRGRQQQGKTVTKQKDRVLSGNNLYISFQYA